MANASGSTSSAVLVNMNDHPILSIDIDSSGDLSYRSLPEINIVAALARDNRHATCFFWRDVERIPFQTSENIASVPFSQDFPFTSKFDPAERIYCYDHTVDNADENTAFLFLEYTDGGRKLVRIKLDTVSDDHLGPYAEREVGPGTEIGSPVRAAMVGLPPPGEKLFFNEPECYFIEPRGQSYLANIIMANSVKLDPQESYEGLLCYKYYDDDEVQEMLHAG